MRSIVRRDTGEGYEAFVKRLAEASGVETPTRGGPGTIRPETQEEDEQQGVEESPRPGREDHKE